MPEIEELKKVDGYLFLYENEITRRYRLLFVVRSSMWQCNTSNCDLAAVGDACGRCVLIMRNATLAISTECFNDTIHTKRRSIGSVYRK